MADLKEEDFFSFVNSGLDLGNGMGVYAFGNYTYKDGISEFMVVVILAVAEKMLMMAHRHITHWTKVRHRTKVRHTRANITCTTGFQMALPRSLVQRLTILVPLLA